MFLVKNRNSNYYCRICLPKKLRAIGYPSEMRFSLYTKNRQDAIDRNFVLASRIRYLINHHTSKVSPISFKELVQREISLIRDKLLDQILTESVPITYIQKPPAKSVKKEREETNQQLLDRFLVKKESEKITRKSLLLLKNRIRHFINYIHCSLSEVTVKKASNYHDQLNALDISSKSVREYISATRQFFNWLILNEVIESNPFTLVKVKRENKLASEERSRWTLKQLQALFQHPNFTHPIGQTASRVTYQRKLEDYWIPILLLYTGARAGEICQLLIKDIELHDNIWCLSINDNEPEKSLKTAASKRLIPIHNKLIELGFLEYVQMRRDSRQKGVFSIKPYGKTQSWSEPFCKRFYKLQNSIGMKSKSRPTVHGFRHTFIDQAQSIGISENEVADIVGHTKPTMTYGRYGKRLDIARLATFVNQIRFDEAVNNIVKMV